MLLEGTHITRILREGVQRIFVICIFIYLFVCLFVVVIVVVVVVVVVDDVVLGG